MSMRSQKAVGIAVVFLAVLGGVGAAVGQSADQQKVAELIARVQAGPAVYFTEDAQSYYLAKGQAVDRNTDRNAAEVSLRSLLAVADMGNAAWSAINDLIMRMPRAVHVVSVSDRFPSGVGSFEDWVATLSMGEKNKLMLKPPFLSYELLAPAEQFVAIERDVVRLPDGSLTINIVFTFHAGAYALSRITGVPIGIDEQLWRGWWDQNRHLAPAALSVSPAAASGTGVVGTSGADLVVGGEYRVYLSTGDVLHGRLESKSEGVFIIEDFEKGGFSFKPTLIDQYELIALPKPSAASKTAAAGGGVVEDEIISYDDLLRRNPLGKELEVKLQSGNAFVGRLARINAEGLVLAVDNAEIPITAGVISTIAVLATVQAAPPAAAPAPTVALPKGPFDTVYVVNTKTDDWGKQLAPLVLLGKVSITDNGVELTLVDGTKKQFGQSEIARISKAATEFVIDDIARYAKPLFCPEGMALIDIPPGKDGRPFFKVCIDQYEYPNAAGGLPRGDISYSQGADICKAQGKRICTVEEWQWACSGLEGYTYPYGWNYDKKTCNTQGIGKWEPSGSYPNCKSKFGVYDMSGNIFEWVVDKDSSPMVMGGPYSKCNAPSAGGGGESKPQIGLRCCKSN